MTNQQRRIRIKELSELINPLNQEKMIASLRYNFLTNPYKQHSDESATEVETLKQNLVELNKKINPLFSEMRQLQVRYIVEYDGEAIQDLLPITIPNKKVFYLSTLVEIDSYQETPDYTNPDIWELLNEVKDFIYFQEYSQFTIQHIKKI